MSFSNTHLRVPRGFGTVLEGLAREVLRDQPEDIPAYAARYFDALLKQREESGLNPAEWSAQLEDRFYNNYAFQNTRTDPDKETASLVTISKEKLYESQTEEESNHSAEASSLSITQPCVSEKPDSTESTDEEEMTLTEKLSISGEQGLLENKAVADKQSDEENSTDTEEDPTKTPYEVDRADLEMEENQNMPQFDSDPTMLSFREISNVVVTPSELGLSSDNGGDQQESKTVDEEIVDSNREEKTGTDEAVESFPFSGLVDVDVCSTDLGGKQKTAEGVAVQESTDVIEGDKDLTSQLEENVELSRSDYEFTQGSQQEEKSQVQNNTEDVRTEAKASYEETNEGLTLSENNDSVVPKNYLAEISVEDVPEAQGIDEVEDEKLMEDASVEILQNNKSETQQKEEFMELIASLADQNVSDSEDQLQFERKDKKESDSDEEDILAFDTMKEKVETNISNLNESDGDDEKEMGVKVISSSDQSATAAEDEIQDHKTDQEDTEEIFEGTTSQNQEPERKQLLKNYNFEQDEISDISGEDEEEGYTEMSDPENIGGSVEENPSQATKSNTSISGKKAEAETFDQHLPLENKQSPRTVGKSQPEDISEEKEIASNQEEEYLGEMTDSDVQQKEENINLVRSSDWTAADLEEDRPDESEDNSTASVNKADKEECSRPQEEEDIMDIPLDDPEANRAAAKIQAGFRGHMTRKKMKPEDKTEGEERQEDRGQ